MLDEFTAHARFAAWLRQAMQVRGYSQRELAAALGCNPVTLTRILSGTRRAGPELCIRLALVLRVPLHTVLHLGGYAPAPGPTDELLSLFGQLPQADQAYVLRLITGLLLISSQEACHVKS